MVRGESAVLTLFARRRRRRFAAYPRLKGCLFIVTYGRSGSTLLQNLLMTIPDCVIRGENNLILETLRTGVEQARDARARWSKPGRDPGHPWFGAHEIDAAALSEAMVAAFLAEVLRPPEGVRWIGFKEIRYAKLGEHLEAHLDFLRAQFPNAHFVFNSRDAAAVAQSAWWAKRKPEEVRHVVSSLDSRFDSYATAHPECSFRTYYETFTTDPGALRPLFERLGEPFDEAAIRAVLARRLSH